MELWDVYDKDRNPTGRQIERGQRLGKGEYHVTVHIAIFTPDGRLLIQRRVDDKPIWPGLWDISAAGSVTAGESSAEGAHRELYEELGLSRDFSTDRPHLTVNYEDGFGDFYILIEEPDIRDLVYQECEVAEARYATLDECLELLHAERFIPYHESFLRLLFDLCKRRSTHSPREDLMFGKRKSIDAE